MLSWAHTGPDGLFCALLVGWLVVVARGLYLARHLITLYILPSIVSSPRVRNLVQAEWVLQGADDMFVAVTSSYLPPLLSFYEIPY